LRLRRNRFATCWSTWFGFFDESLFLPSRSLPRLFGVRDFDFFSERSEGIKPRV
jgi:hypothetical protein